MEKSDLKFEVGFENASDVTRIYHLIQRLKDGDQVKFVDDIRFAFQVVFRGTPSLRHANKISLFRDYLSEALHTELRVAAAKPGSVEVFFSTEESTNNDNVSDFSNIFSNLSESQKGELSSEYWIEKISFGTKVFNF
jgi:hypothetical protein